MTSEKYIPKNVHADFCGCVPFGSFFKLSSDGNMSGSTEFHARFETAESFAPSKTLSISLS